jgi:hypothetical protein
VIFRRRYEAVAVGSGLSQLCRRRGSWDAVRRNSAGVTSIGLTVGIFCGGHGGIS